MLSIAENCATPVICVETIFKIFNTAIEVETQPFFTIKFGLKQIQKLLFFYIFVLTNLACVADGDCKYAYLKTTDYYDLNVSTIVSVAK